MELQTTEYLIGGLFTIFTLLFGWLKYDIASLGKNTRADIKDLRESTRADIKDLRESTRADISGLRESTRADISGLKNDIENLKDLFIKYIAKDKG